MEINIDVPVVLVLPHLTVCHILAFELYIKMHTNNITFVVGIWLRPLDNAAYVACLLLICQGSEWLNGRSGLMVGASD